jgi:SAM-dependent methyltransferase
VTDSYVSESEIRAGYAIYNRFFLSFYDFYVIHFSNRWIWRCPKKFQQEQYARYATTCHLDIGVGTGYYLKHHHWPKNTQLGLMDMNPFSLKAAKRAVQFLSPECYQADIFKRQEALQNHFSSISMNYLLHCLPGSMHAKSVVVEHVVSMLKSGGVLFGSTILSDDKLHTFASRKLMRFYNKKGIFSNRYDTYSTLRDILQKYLVDINIQIVGCVALFNGRRSV